jgi:hypothetical protein
LYHNPEVREQYRQTFQLLLTTHWNESKLLAEVDRVEAMLNNELGNGQRQFSRAVRSVRRFITERRGVLEQEFARWPIPLYFGPRSPIMAEAVGHGQASFSTVWNSDAPNAPETHGDVELDLTLNGKPVKFRQIGVSAELSNDKKQASNDRELPPAIVFTGMSEPDGRRMVLTMTLPRENFHPSKTPVGMSGVIIEGTTISFLAKLVFQLDKLKLIQARSTLSEASMEPGATVRGHMEFDVHQFLSPRGRRVEWVE